MTDRLEQLVAGCVDELGFDTEAVELTPAGKHRVLRIAIDKDGGVTIDDIAAVTRAISIELDSTDVMGQLPYTLEVTSRGVDRPLSEPRHWRRNVGRLVSVILTDGTNFDGRIVSSDGQEVNLSLSGGDRRISFTDVAKALIQTELNPKGR